MNGYGFKCENLFDTFIKKAFLSELWKTIIKKKVSAVINSESPGDKDYDFEVADTIVNGDMKFTYIELYCN